MTISVELDRTDGHEGPAVRVRWTIGAAHTPERATVRHEAILDPSEACEAAEVVTDKVRSAADEHELQLVTARGVVGVRAPRAFWLGLASALEIVSARVWTGAAHVAQRLDLEADGRVIRVAGTPAGWQVTHEGA